MVIGIHAVAAFKKERTGVEEYAYNIIKNMAVLKSIREHRVILYTDRKADLFRFLPDNFKIQIMRFPFLWTQVRLSLFLKRNPPDVLFIPAHVLPIIHPCNSVVTIHGLEFEYYPEYYPKLHCQYLRWTTKYALKNAKKIIASSENTKKDLIKIYKADERKITVVHLGANELKGLHRGKKVPKYILYAGRIEMKKNIIGLVKAFNISKKKYKIPHHLILVGKQGYGADKIRNEIRHSRFRKEIILTDYLDRNKYLAMLRNSDLFAFPSFYEGFGIPILEAQVMGVPVMTSNISSMPEVAGKGAIYVDPHVPLKIADAIYEVISNNTLKNHLIEQGYENSRNYSWEKSAQEIFNVLTSM